MKYIVTMTYYTPKKRFEIITPEEECKLFMVKGNWFNVTFDVTLKEAIELYSPCYATAMSEKLLKEVIDLVFSEEKSELCWRFEFLHNVFVSSSRTGKAKAKPDDIFRVVIIPESKEEYTVTLSAPYIGKIIITVDKQLNITKIETENPRGEYKIKGKIDDKLIKKSDIFKKVNKEMQGLQLHKALDLIWGFVKECNTYINDKEPWKEEDKEKVADTLITLAEAIRRICIYLAAFIPDSVGEIRKQFGFSDEKIADLDKMIYSCSIGKSEILLKKI